ncbi:CreA family protein [Agarilytica rhodophyticola]|uniref:CreA family protein n=1 Tax=Agarilytica rhodophyticola TaxID=1737490 RepID=UPI000B344738|nr:CreA family protein [Agarilytica rhodophyticola]
MLKNFFRRVIQVLVIVAIVVALIFTAMYFLTDRENQVGDVSLGVLTSRDIKIEKMVDPKIPGVTCYIAHVKGNFDFVDPSNSSISCRQTGPINIEHMQSIDLSDHGEIVFKKSKSIFLKAMKIRRIFDKNSKTLLYLSYSTTEIDGNYEHSLSTVPLYGNPVWDEVDSLMAL